jgi:hypothetical protein
MFWQFRKVRDRWPRRRYRVPYLEWLHVYPERKPLRTARRLFRDAARFRELWGMG